MTAVWADTPDRFTAKALPHWNFVDWPVQWSWSNERPTGGVPPGGVTGGSSIISLQLAYTLKDAIELLKAYGEPELAARYTTLYDSLCKHTRERCRDSLVTDECIRAFCLGWTIGCACSRK